MTKKTSQSRILDILRKVHRPQSGTPAAHRYVSADFRTYLGYPNTTGLSTIQYRISDAIADPQGTAEALSSEALLRLPDCFHCYRPDEDTRSDFTPPSAQRGGITFASFNAAAKINPPLIDAWSRILTAMPDARLLLKNRAFDDELARAPVREVFAGHAIALDRIVFDTHQESRAEHMARYRAVDIALDTFPYNGSLNPKFWCL